MPAQGELGLELVSIMAELTWERHGHLALENARRNKSLIAKGASLAALRDAPIGQGTSAIVVAAGPSIRRRDPIARIKESGFKGALVATESALSYCLRNGVVPDLTVTLDPHATRIVRWFGDPSLNEEALRKDDYYRRQDMDDVFASELRANEEVLNLLDRYGKSIRIALCSSASQAVVNRVHEIGMDVYWWNPMCDDPDRAGSITEQLQRENGLPSVNAGGNVGAAAWMMASAVLGKKHVALTGMDFSYYDDTPYERTQYYHEAVALVGQSNLDALFMRIYNPYTGAWFYTDPAYRWYREIFLQMAADADCRTYNCTEGGILFGDCVDFIPLDDFLAKQAAWPLKG